MKERRYQTLKIEFESEEELNLFDLLLNSVSRVEYPPRCEDLLTKLRQAIQETEERNS